MHVIKKYGLTVALTIVVIISLILSIVLWSNPSYEHTKRNNSSSSNDTIVSKPLSYTYLPTQAIHTNRYGHQWIITDPDTNIVSEFIKRTNGGSQNDNVSFHSSKNYVKHLNRRRSIILSYQNNVTTPIFNSVAKGGFGKLPNREFNRIILPLNGTIIIKRLRKIPVKIRTNYGRPIVTYPKDVTMPQYEYLINKQTQNYYIMRLLNGTHNIARTRKKNHVTYSNESSRQLIFGPNKNATYVNDRPTHINGNFNQSLYNSYHNLLTLNLPLNGVHYFNYDPKSHTILYRGFVESFPIFNPTHFGTVSMQAVNGELRYNYSLYSLQIPIPNDRKRIKLSNTRQVLKNLKSRGYNLRNVQAIEIGYEWQNAKTSKILANLIPTWFIKYNGHWLNYNQLGIAK
ncbi:MAG: hypothetical protein AJITA_00015 [Acetilactobacillus jinshanensis]